MSSLKLRYHFNSKKPYEVLENIKVLLSDGSMIIIPKGFRSDGSSSPSSMWGLFPPFGDFILAALTHDYLYNIETHRGRRFADREMLTISNKYNNRSIFKICGNYIRYSFVRIFGLKHFN